MFFPEKITQIKPADKVLEVGPGSLPHPRSDVFLDKIFNSDLAVAQRGFAEKINLNKPIFYYRGGFFPFKDKEFDYIICSHVIEHVPADELDTFISELQRVASRGYIEFPNIFYELINFQPVHLWLMNFKNNSIYFLDKNLFKSDYIHKIYREMFYGQDKYLKAIFERYRQLFFCGFEWIDKINYKTVNQFDDLVNEDDYKRYHEYFINFQPTLTNSIYKKPTMIKRIINKLKRILQGIMSLFIKSQQDDATPKISKNAILEKRELIQLGDFSEIKDFVIIRTHTNPVKIGRYCQLNPFTVIYGGSGVIIGDNVMIGPHCVIAAGNHNYKQIDVPMRFAGSLTKGPITIEDNVWIGANCTITDGVTIGKDSVVGANSVVVNNVNPYEIVAGTPAKVISTRK